MKGKDVFMKLLRHPSPIVIILGEPDTGKTDLSLRIAEDGFNEGLIDLGASNIEIYDDSRFSKVTCLKSLELWLEFHKRANKIFILDEADRVFTNLDVITKLYKRTRTFLAYQHRKFRLKVFLIYHRFEDLPELFKDTNYVLAYIFKISKKTAKVYSRLFDEPIKVNNIPRTSIKFNTYAIGEFSEDNPNEVKQFELLRKVLELKKKGFEDWQINEILAKNG